MLQYYEKRAPDYEDIYDKPERRDDLIWLENKLLGEVAGRWIVEIACGTGYWTRRMASVAKAILATDVSSKLATAAGESVQTGCVSTAVADIYSLPSYSKYDCVVGGFIYSHVPCAQRQQVLQSIQQSLGFGRRLVLFDNKFVPGSSTAISKRTDAGDTVQVRTLSDGSNHEVIKNFPSATELSNDLQSICSSVEVNESEHFWFATGEIGG